MIREFTPDRAEKTSKNKPLLSFVRSENRVNSIWQYLKRYEDPTFVNKRLRADYPSIGTILRKKKAQHVADCIRQAEAYFETARTSDLSIKPLIIYYGMLDLVKALMLFGDNQLTLDDDTLKNEGLNSHGLTHGTRCPNDVSIRDNVNNLLNEFCYISFGRNTNTVYSLLHECWSTNKPTNSTKVVLGDLLSAHPSTWRSYAEHTSKMPRYFKATDSFRTTANGYEHFIGFEGTFRFDTYGYTPIPGNSNLFFTQQMPRLASSYTNDTVYGPYGYASKRIPTSLEEYQPVYRATTGGSYTMADPIPNMPLHPIEIEFLAMFILGSLARYAPQKWLKNVQYGGGGEMFVVEGIINSATVSFPKMILEELDNRTYTFTGDSSYWG